MQKKSESGLTLVELLVVIIIIGILGTGAISLMTGAGIFFRGRDVSASEEMAKVYLQKLYPSGTDIGAACVQRDTNNDGYLSCDGTVTINGQVQTASLECAAPWSLNQGCKRKQFVLPNQ